MAQTHYVKQRGKGHKGPHPELRCQSCGKPIEVGQPYKWFKMKLSRGGVKKSYHTDCQIPPSHRTTSRMGQIWDAQAGLQIDGLETLDEIQTELQSLAESVREVAEGYTESASNIESGFGHQTEQGYELEDKGQQLESWADDLESFDFSDEEPQREDFDEGDDGQDEYETEREQWLDNMRSEAQNEADNCPV